MYLHHCLLFQCHQISYKFISLQNLDTSTGLIVGISVIVILSATVLMIMFSVLWLVKKRHTKAFDISR